jgi:dihydroorotase/N-acyl-D-amino-acid deacylase
MGRIAIGALALASASVLSAQPPAYDLVIRNARFVDGTGTPWYRGALAVRGDTIVEVAASIDAGGARVIDAAGQAVAPGFIDIHTHARRGIFQVPTADNYVRQGVTTLIEGPDGSSPVPLAPFLEKLGRLQKAVNIGSFIGQGSVRAEVIGNVDRKGTPEEILKMQALVEQGMRDGAFGLSTGLFYVPGSFTPLEEVIELAKVAARFGGMHKSHQREESIRVLDSVRETIAIGERGGLPTQVTHHKIIGKANWGRSADTLRLIDEARGRGVDVTSDQYPYTASSTSVSSALMPAWALEGGRQATTSRLKDPATRARIRAETITMIRDARGGGDPQNVQFASCGFDPSLAGTTLADLTARRGMEPTIENAADVTLWIFEQGGCQGIFHAMSDDDVQRIMQHPATMIGSDGEVPTFGRANPHPRSYGTFARVLGLYVREKKALTLEEAVRKMTAFPAARLKITDRGILRPGMKADIVIFDPATVRDTATFEKPHSYAEGFSHVIVNGQVVFEKGAMTAARPGRVLYGPGRSASPPRYFRRPVEIQSQRDPARPLRAQAVAEVVPLPVLLARPADLREGRQPGERHELDVADIGERLRPQRRLDAEKRAFRHSRRGGRRVPVVRGSDIDDARPGEADRRARAVLHVEVRPVGDRHDDRGPLRHRFCGGRLRTPVLHDRGREQLRGRDLVPADHPLAVRLHDPLHALDEGVV